MFFWIKDYIVFDKCKLYVVVIYLIMAFLLNYLIFFLFVWNIKSIIMEGLSLWLVI